MKTYKLNEKFSFNPETRTFTASEKDVQFATTYELINPKSGMSMVFDFTHSTGPEFDPNTKWVYKSKEGFFFEVCNDAQMAKIHAENYLKAKMR